MESVLFSEYDFRELVRKGFYIGTQLLKGSNTAYTGYTIIVQLVRQMAAILKP